MINAAGVSLVTKSESIKLKAYFCPAGVPTIGRGHTKGITAEMVRAGYTITAAEEQALFESDMEQWENDVLSMLTRKPNENQLAAFVSLAFNIGLTAFKNSSVKKAFERGDDQAAARAFGLWNKITNPKTKQLVVSNGLTIRRNKESTLFLTPVAGEDEQIVAEPMPQAVEPPKTMGQSTINRAGLVAGSTTAVVAVSESINTVNTLKASVDGLGNWVVPLLLVVAIAAIGYIVWERFNQRNNGNA